MAAEKAWQNVEQANKQWAAIAPHLAIEFLENEANASLEQHGLTPDTMPRDLPDGAPNEAAAAAYLKAFISDLCQIVDSDIVFDVLEMAVGMSLNLYLMRLAVHQPILDSAKKAAEGRRQGPLADYGGSALRRSIAQREWADLKSKIEASEPGILVDQLYKRIAAESKFKNRHGAPFGARTISDGIKEFEQRRQERWPPFRETSPPLPISDETPF